MRRKKIIKSGNWKSASLSLYAISVYIPAAPRLLLLPDPAPANFHNPPHGCTLSDISLPAVQALSSASQSKWVRTTHCELGTGSKSPASLSFFLFPRSHLGLSSSTRQEDLLCRFFLFCFLDTNGEMEAIKPSCVILRLSTHRWTWSI